MAPRPQAPSRLSGFVDDIRFAVRRMRKSPLVTATAVAIMAIGVGASTATFSVLDAVLLSPLPYEDSGQLVQVWETHPGRVRAQSLEYSDFGINANDFVEYREAGRSLADMAWTLRYADTGVATIGGGDGPPQVVGAMSVSPNFFSLLGTTPFLGRAFLAEETAPPDDGRWTPVVILSNEIWRSRFASDPDILGRQIMFEGGPSTVVGVLPAGFRFPSLHWRGAVRPRDVDIYLPLHYPAYTQPRAFRQFWVIGRLRPGVEPAQAAAELTRLRAGIEAEHPPTRPGWRVVVTPLRELIVRDYGKVLFSLLAMAGLVLLIACADVANLLLAQGTRRHAELAVRAAIGGGRGRLVRLLMSESLLLALVGGILGTLLAGWGTDWLVGLAPADIARVNEAGLDGRALAFALLVAVTTGIAFGLFPAWRFSRLDLVTGLRGGDRTSAGTAAGTTWSGSTRLLIAGQVALTLVLLVGAGLFGKSFLALRGADRGFDTANVLAVEFQAGDHHRFRRVQFADLELREERWRASMEIMERLRALPGVEAVAVGEVQIDDLGIWPMQLTEEAAREEMVDAFLQHVSPEYFDVLEIPLLRGEGLPAWGDGEDGRRYWWATACEAVDPAYCTALVSQTFAETVWPGEDPIGKGVGVYGCCWTVAGVVADVHPRGIDAPPLWRPANAAMRVYVPYTEMGPFLVKAGANPESLVASIRDVVRSVDRDGAVEVTTVEQQIADSLARPRFYSVMAVLFAAVATVMALVGLYGVVAYLVGRRVREIGVRMALGARKAEILTMIVAQGMRPVLLGVVVGLAASVGLARTIQSLLYGMDPLDPWVVSGMSAAMIIVSAAACYSPARRASRVDPVRALSSE